MSLNKTEIVVNNNEVTILKFIKIMCDWCNLTTEKLATMTNKQLKFYVAFVLNRVKVDEYKLAQLRYEIEEKGRILEEFKRAYVKGDSYSDIPVVRDSSKPADTRAIKMIQLREEQTQRIIEYDITEKNVKAKHLDIANFMDLIINPRFAEIMKLTYLRGMTNTKIVHHLNNVTIEYVDTARYRSLYELTNLIKKVVRGNKQ